MQNLIFQDIDSTVERIRMLESIAFDITESYNYLRTLSEDEIADEQTVFSEEHLALERIETRKRELMEEINAEIKVHRLRAQKALEKIRTRREDVTETVYIIQDFDSRQIGIYNNRGELIHERNMRANEMQHKMNFDVQSDDRTLFVKAS